MPASTRTPAHYHAWTALLLILALQAEFGGALQRLGVWWLPLVEAVVAHSSAPDQTTRAMRNAVPGAYADSSMHD